MDLLRLRLSAVGTAVGKACSPSPSNANATIDLLALRSSVAPARGSAAVPISADAPAGAAVDTAGAASAAVDIDAIVPAAADVAVSNVCKKRKRCSWYDDNGKRHRTNKHSKIQSKGESLARARLAKTRACNKVVKEDMVAECVVAVNDCARAARIPDETSP